MKHLALFLAATLALAGCGHAPLAAAPRAGNPAAMAAAKPNPFLGLTKLEHGPGGAGIKKNAVYHVSAKTKLGGYLRLYDMGEFVACAYNYDEITVPAKLQWIGEAIEQLAATATPADAKVLADMKAKLLQANPYLGLTDLAFADGPPPDAPFWHLATRHVATHTKDGGNLCLVEQRDVAYEFGIVRNGKNVLDGRQRFYAVEAFAKALPTVTDPELASFIKDRLGL